MGKEMITVAVAFNIRFGAARWTSEAAVWRSSITAGVQGVKEAP